jgi:ATP-binding protein involved in chromosome partitioning
MRRIRTYNEVADPGAEDVIGQVVAQGDRLAVRLARVRRIIVVASGKGGVGKSAVAANLAAALGTGGLAVGAVDADLNGPSLARMLGAARQRLRVDEDGVEPAAGAAGVRVMSMDLLLPADDAPLRWRNAGEQPPDPETGEGGFTPPAFLFQSTLEGGVLREFLADTRWGDLDALVIDAPPGTDKLIRLLQLLPRIDAVLLVTTPAEIARFVVAKSVRVAKDAGARAIGVVGNMTAHVCESCGHRTSLFVGDGVRRLADESGVEIWADVPFDPRLAWSTDRGTPFVLEQPDAVAAVALRALADRIASLPASEIVTEAAP